MWSIRILEKQFDKPQWLVQRNAVYSLSFSKRWGVEKRQSGFPSGSSRLTGQRMSSLLPASQRDPEGPRGYALIIKALFRTGRLGGWVWAGSEWDAGFVNCFLALGRQKYKITGLLTKLYRPKKRTLSWGRIVQWGKGVEQPAKGIWGLNPQRRQREGEVGLIQELLMECNW